MSDRRKRPTVRIIQQDFGCGDGWEDVDERNTLIEALELLKEYKRNQPAFRVRMLTRFLDGTQASPPQ